MILGPEGFTGIALLGTASASMSLAPFKDPAWAIWGCSPGAYPICAQNRSDAWFEPHRWQPSKPGQFGAPGTKQWFSPEFHKFLTDHKGPVFMTEVDETIPNSVRIPYKALIERYGPYHWTSTVAYMMAMAINELQARAAAGEKVSIGLWGIDMSATEEYAYQRPALQHFVGLAMSVGIAVIVPPESDLMRPPTMYGIGEHSPRHIRMLARMNLIDQNIASISQQLQAGQLKLAELKGSKAELEYMIGSWTDDIDPDLTDAVSFARESTQPVGAMQEAINAAKSTGAAVVDMQGAKAG